MEDVKIKKHLYKEGDEVAHKENCEQLMEVRRIIQTKKNERKYIVGIECGWWTTEGKYEKEVFHSRVLVPWNIAEKSLVEGRHVVINWLEGNR